MMPSLFRELKSCFTFTLFLAVAEAREGCLVNVDGTVTCHSVIPFAAQIGIGVVVLVLGIFSFLVGGFLYRRKQRKRGEKSDSRATGQDHQTENQRDLESNCNFERNSSPQETLPEYRPPLAQETESTPIGGRLDHHQTRVSTESPNAMRDNSSESASQTPSQSADAPPPYYAPTPQ